MLKKQTRDKLRITFEENRKDITDAMLKNDFKTIFGLVKVTIAEDTDNFDYMKYFFDIKNVGFDDEVEYEIEDPTQAAEIFSVSPGGTVLKTNVPKGTQGVKLTSNFEASSYRYNSVTASNVYPKLEEMISKIEEELSNKLLKAAVSLVASTINGDPTYDLAPSASALESTLIQVIDTVSDELPSNSELYIIGRRPALRKAISIANPSQNWLETVEKEGIVGYFYGVPLVQVRKVGRAREHLLEANQLYVVSPSCGLFVNFGDLIDGEYQEDEWTTRYTVMKKYGAVVNKQLGRVYRITVS